jgi:hypothetical protein
MKLAFWGLALLGAAYCLHRIALSAERRGWIYYRHKRGGGDAVGNALLQVQAIVEPSKRYVLEERVKDDSEARESGDPPTAGEDRGPTTG